MRHSQEIDDLNSRVRKLEALLATKNSSEIPGSAPTFRPVLCAYLDFSSRVSADFLSAKTTNETSTEIELEKAVTWIETDAFEHEPSPPGVSYNLSSQRLQMLNCFKDNIATRAKIAEGFGSFLFAFTRPRIAPSLTMNVVATLPTRIQGEALLEIFLQEILWIYHLIHAPTVTAHFNKLYNTIENGQEPDYGPLALISTIFALSAYFSSKTSGLFFKHADSMSYCHKWTLLYASSVYQPK